MCHKLKWTFWDNVVVRHTKWLLHSKMFLAGLYLPTSDMDIVIINSHCTDIPRALRAIGNILVENQMAKNIQVLTHPKGNFLFLFIFVCRFQHLWKWQLIGHWLSTAACLMDSNSVKNNFLSNTAYKVLQAMKVKNMYHARRLLCLRPPLLQVIAMAKVPIIKFDDTLTGLAFDVSFDVANGPKTAKLVAELMDSLPPMRQLVIILKLFLQQRDMNEVSAFIFYWRTHMIELLSLADPNTQLLLAVTARKIIIRYKGACISNLDYEYSLGTESSQSAWTLTHFSDRRWHSYSAAFSRLTAFNQGSVLRVWSQL